MFRPTDIGRVVIKAARVWAVGGAPRRLLDF